jgi:hypothetical protein
LPLPENNFGAASAACASTCLLTLPAVIRPYQSVIMWPKAGDERGEFGLTVCVKGILNP